MVEQRKSATIKTSSSNKTARKTLLILTIILCSGMAAPAWAQMLPGVSDGNGGTDTATLTILCANGL